MTKIKDKDRKPQKAGRVRPVRYPFSARFRKKEGHILHACPQSVRPVNAPVYQPGLPERLCHTGCFVQKVQTASLPCACQMEAVFHPPGSTGKGGRYLIVPFLFREQGFGYVLEFIHHVAGSGDALLLANRALHAQVERKRKCIRRRHGKAQLAYAGAALVARRIDVMAVGP